MSEDKTRQETRVDVSAARAFTLAFEQDGERVESYLIDMSREGIRVELAADNPVQLKDGARIDAALLASAKYDVAHMLQLTVEGQLPQTPEGARVLRLRSANELTRARLWEALLSVTGRDIVPTGTAEAPSEVPRIPQLPKRGFYTEAARKLRAAFVREHVEKPLKTLEQSRLDATRLTGNIENFIGGVEIPVGVAGPLFFRGECVSGMVFAPFATTEGSLVESASRGALAVTRSGGVTTRVLNQRMMRVPLFVMEKMVDAATFSQWIDTHLEAIREEISAAVTHARLVSIEPRMLGNMVHVAFVYETGDAAGRSMTTRATWRACQYMMKQVGEAHGITFENFLIEANMSGDKKVNFNSFIRGRGTRVLAETFVSEDALRSVLKVTSQQLSAAHQGILAGSIQVGMVGHNINVANIVAGMFTACGQDIASVHESSLAHLHIEAVNGGVYASILLPSLIIGTVGGGTHLGDQKDYLEMIDCAGSGKGRRFAEIMAGFALALDLAALSAVAGGQFATDRDVFRKKRSINWLRPHDLNLDLFATGLRSTLSDEEVVVTKLTPIDNLKMESTIITELTARKSSKLMGHFPFALDYRTGDGTEHHVDVVAKVKPLDEEITLMVRAMASMCGGQIAANFNKYYPLLGFAGCHGCELAIYSQTAEPFRKYLPKVYGIIEDPEREAYILIMELLRDMVLMNTEDDVSGWSQPHIDHIDGKPVWGAGFRERVIDGLAELHSVWYGREEELLAQPWLGRVTTAEDMVEMTPLWESLEVYAADEFPDLFPQRVVEYHLEFVRTIGEWWPKMEAMPRTLIHNDFNPRNLCLRPTDEGLRLCVYDWELATLGVPQHDLAEFLAFTLDETVTKEEIDHYVELHRTRLAHHAGVEIDPKTWREGYRYALMDLVVNRLAFYAMAHTFRHYGFMERLVGTMRKILRMEIGLDS